MQAMQSMMESFLKPCLQTVGQAGPPSGKKKTGAARGVGITFFSEIVHHFAVYFRL